MKITIIPIDGAVYKDGVAYDKLTLDFVPSNIHALQWNNNSGWIEFNDGFDNEEIQSLPEWANNCVSVWEAADFLEKTPPVPTSEQLIALCKAQAKALLAASDWAVLSDVGLKNAADYVTYRGILRGLVTQPQENPDFPTTPEPVWS